MARTATERSRARREKLKAAGLTAKTTGRVPDAPAPQAPAAPTELERLTAIVGAMEKRLQAVEDRLADVAPLLTPAPPMRNTLDALRDQIAQVQGRAPVLSTPAPQPIVDNWDPA